jgi:4'-phosphopantetheinyl transferase
VLARPALFWASTERFDVDAAEERLTPAERLRAQRYRDPASRSRFVLGAQLLRHAVEDETGVAADAFVVTRRCADCGREHGRPLVAPATTDDETEGRLRDVSVSVSHSGAWVVVAVCAAGLVGVDIEVGTDRAAAGLLDDLVLHPAEVDPAPATRERLLRAWVRKEALLKATGDGLRLPPAGILLSERPRLRVDAWAERPELVPRSAIVDLDYPADVVGAVAVVGDGAGPVVVEPVVNRW